MFKPNQISFKMLTVNDRVLSFDEYIARRVLERLNDIYKEQYTGVSVESYLDLGFPSITVFSVYRDSKKVGRILIKYNIGSEPVWYTNEENKYMYNLKEQEQSANNYYLEIPLTLEPNNIMIGDLNRYPMN